MKKRREKMEKELRIETNSESLYQMRCLVCERVIRYIAQRKRIEIERILYCTQNHSRGSPLSRNP